MGVYSVHLVGESRYQDAVKRLREGEMIDLLPEPDNAYDPRAIKAVDVNGDTVGYLERGSWLTRAMLDENASVSARVKAIIGGERGKPSRGVLLEVRTSVDAEEKSTPSSAWQPRRLPLNQQLFWGLVLGLALIALSRCS